MTPSKKGTHADVFEGVREKVLLSEPTPEILQEGVLFVLEAFDNEGIYTKVAKLELDVERIDNYLVDVKSIENRYGFSYAQDLEKRKEAMLEHLRLSLKKEDTMTYGLYQGLSDLESRLRSKRELHGVEIDAAPPTLAEVQEIKRTKELILEIEQRAIEFMLNRLADDETAAGEAVKFYTDVFQPAWDEHKGKE